MFDNSRKPQQSSNSNNIFWLIIAGMELLQQLNLCACAESVNPINYVNASSNLFRFRGDFEPRYAGKEKFPYLDTAESRSAATAADDNGKDGDVTKKETRQSRGFQFHADRNDITIDIEFIVPFVKIPVERSMEVTASAFRNLVNLNTGSLLVSGAFVAVGAVVASIVKTLSTPILIPNYRDKKKKVRAEGRPTNLMESLKLVSYANATNDSDIEKKSEIKVDDLVNRLEKKLHDNNIDMSACIQKSICSYVKQASADVRMGKGSGIEKIIDGFANLEQVGNYLSGTAVQNAIDAGKSTNNCDYIYHSCRWSQPANIAMKFITNYLNYFNT